MKKKILWIVFTLIIIAGILVNIFLVNPNELKIREVTIADEKISDDFDDFLIVFFSDTLIVDNDMELLDKAIESINSFSPDLILFGGDLLEEGSKTDIEILKEKLNGLSARYAKYAVLGDRDNDTSASILEECGFKVLKNESTPLYLNKDSFINIVGLESMVNGSPDVDAAFESVNSSAYTLVLSHTPDTFSMISNGKADYVLAGHSLGGKVYFPLISLFNRPLGAEIYLRGTTTEGSVTLNITNGIGNGNKKARLLADPEIVVIKLCGN